MEDFRAVKISLLAAAAVAVLLLLWSPGALAYNNVNAHPSINGYAYDTFVKFYMPYDQYLKSASLEGSEVWGEAWDLQDGGTWHDRLDPVRRQKSIAVWLQDSGFSADEPEIDMALIHFYDPVRMPHYLTDTVNDIFGDKAYVNPEIDAYQWAFTDTDNPYCFANGKTYYTDALAGTDPDTVKYGQAWRSVGETMHLISDMTIPAHVRNDGHIPYLHLWDPLEYFTDTSHVNGYSFYDPSTSLGNFHSAYSSETDIRTLFKNEALWTNRNFFSGDTVPVYGSTTMGNGEKLYPSPTVTWSPSFEGYITATVDGRTLKMARQSLAGWIWKTPYLVVDQTVCDDQRSILIPTAIKTSAAVLDAFLPRFKVVLDSVKPDPEDPDYYVVKAHIEHVATREWPNDLTIRNGAFITIDDIDTPVYLEDNAASDDNLNKIQVSIEAKTGDNVQVYYNLGGYQICSAIYKIPAVSATPTSKATAKPTQQSSTPDVETWLSAKYHPSYTSFYSNNQPIQTWYYSNHDLLDDSFIVNYYEDGTVRTATYYGEDGEPKWVRYYDEGGTLTKYVTYDDQNQPHTVYDDGSNPEIDFGNLMPPM
jgi:hypothetical protein